MNQSCQCQGNDNYGYQNSQMTSCGCQSQGYQGFGCSCNNSYQGCPRPQPLVAPKRVCMTQQVTPVPQPVICPIECRRVNRCMYYPVFYPQYVQTFVNEPMYQSY